MKSFVSRRSLAARRMTPKPLHDAGRALTGSRWAMSSASAFEEASMVMRTDRDPSLSQAADAASDVADAGRLPRSTRCWTLPAQPPRLMRRLRTRMYAKSSTMKMIARMM